MISLRQWLGDVSMSVDITRFVDTVLKEKTTVYSPIIEAVVNSIEAIWETGRSDGKIIIKPIRKSQSSMDSEAKADVMGFVVEDNGIGFNIENTKAFDTMCTSNKAEGGGKGLGRFIFLKYFNNANFSSIYKDNGKYRKRVFSLGLKTDIIENMADDPIEASDTLTTVTLKGLKQQSYDKVLDTIAKKLLERILIFFVDDRFSCPTIILREDNREIILNQLIGNDQDIQPIHTEQFSLSGFKIPGVETTPIEFLAKIYKIVYPGGLTSKVYLTANGRVVTETSISKYIPEFKDDFIDKDGEQNKNYRIAAYIIGNYLDENVTFERGKFNFPEESTAIGYPLSQKAIEKHSTSIVEKILTDQVCTRRQERKDAFKKYVDESAPWYKTYLDEIDYTSIPSDLNEQIMETELHKIKSKKEQLAKSELRKVINDPKIELYAKVRESVKLVQQAGVSDLIHYIALRKIVLDLLKKLLEIKDNGEYSKEAEVHNLIYPIRSGSEITNYSDHNLWILDEKLNFTEAITSDKPIDDPDGARPDLIIYDIKWAYRSDNEKSNPITIFEFKKPGRYDFINLSTKEDPIEQIKRYVIEIRHKRRLTTQGREIQVDDNTPFYGYLICDFNEEVRNWLREQKNLNPMPDGMGYFGWFDGIRLYLEVITWDKLLKDSEQRNKIFFKKLGFI